LAVARADRSPGWPFRTWFPPAFFAAVALGTLPVIATNLFAPSAAISASAAAILGREYVAVQLPAFDRNPLLIHFHAVIGLAIVLLAPFQFWRGFRNRHRRLHRVMGYVVASCLALLATTGVAVAIVYPFSGIAGVIPNVLWMSAILFYVGRAVMLIRRRDMVGHETWMTRAMAITLGVTFASLYLPLLNGPLHLPARLALAVSFWLGVCECLGVAELWLRRPGRPGVRPRKV
jgi:uncharacterized membrane protein